MHPMERARSWLRPDLWVGAVSEIGPEALHARGIRGLILDLDDTLVAALEHQPPPAVEAWVERMSGEFRLFILSNNASPSRVQRIAERLGLPCAARAAKPRRQGFRAAIAQLDLTPSEVAIVGDQLFTDVLGGHRIGAYTILATPMSPEHKPWRKLMRLVEGMLVRDLAALRHPLHPPEEMS